MPPAVLTSSTAIFMPLETGTPQTLIGPDRSWWVPITISLAEMPSLVTLVWAAAGRVGSAGAPTARPSALNDFDISSLLCWPVLSEGPGLSILRRFQNFCAAHATAASPSIDSDSV